MPWMAKIRSSAGRVAAANVLGSSSLLDILNRHQGQPGLFLLSEMVHKNLLMSAVTLHFAWGTFVMVRGSLY